MEYQNENFNGTYDFRSRSHNGWVMGANLHEYSEILYCKKGTVRVVVNGRSLELCDGQFVWIPPNYVHQFDCPSAEVLCAVFSNDFIPIFFKEQRARHYCVSAIDAEELREVLERLAVLNKNDPCTVCGCLNLICAKVLAQASFECTRQADGTLYQKVISYISENYTESISLPQLAGMFGYNEKYLSHTLHELTGIHFRQLLNSYRITHAKELLKSDTDQGITTIAMKSGFSSANTFHRVFLQTVGTTPSEYRKNNKIT